MARKLRLDTFMRFSQLEMTLQDTAARGRGVALIASNFIEELQP
jgi:hypothetical protein